MGNKKVSADRPFCLFSMQNGPAGEARSGDNILFCWYGFYTKLKLPKTYMKLLSQSLKKANVGQIFNFSGNVVESHYGNVERPKT